MNDPVEDMLCVEVDGLTLEIGVAPGAVALDTELPAVIAAAITAAKETAGPAQGALTIVIDDDARIRELNRLWRGFDTPTNVLYGLSRLALGRPSITGTMVDRLYDDRRGLFHQLVRPRGT